MTIQDPKALLVKFAPIVYLHPDEEYMPCSIEKFFEWCWLKYMDSEIDGDELVDKPVTILSSVNSTNLNQQTYYSPLFQRQCYSSYKRNGRKDKFFLALKTSEHRLGENVAQVPFYGSVVETTAFIDLNYNFFYSYNGTLGPHEGDWERVAIRIDTSQTKILGVFMAAHGDSSFYTRWYYPRPAMSSSSQRMYFDVESVDGVNRVVVYSAEESHASYPTAGEQVYADYAGFRPNDWTGKGTRWNPASSQNIVVLTGTEPWLDFDGEFGANGGPYSPLLNHKVVDSPVGGPFVSKTLAVTRDSDFFGERYSVDLKLDFPASVKWTIRASITQAQCDGIQFTLYENILNGWDEPAFQPLKNNGTSAGYKVNPVYVGDITYKDPSTGKTYEGDDVFDQLGIEALTLVVTPV